MPTGMWGAPRTPRKKTGESQSFRFPTNKHRAELKSELASSLVVMATSLTYPVLQIHVRQRGAHVGGGVQGRGRRGGSAARGALTCFSETQKPLARVQPLPGNGEIPVAII